MDDSCPFTATGASLSGEAAALALAGSSIRDMFEPMMRKLEEDMALFGVLVWTADVRSKIAGE